MTKPRHTVVYSHGGGRLGNQIIRCAHWLAWAKREADAVEVVNLAFWPYARLFAGGRENRAAIFPLRPSSWSTLARIYASLPRTMLAFGERRTRFGRAVHAAGRRAGWQVVALDDVRHEAIDLDGPEFTQRVRAARVTVCSGWRIAGWRLVGEMASELRAWFQPARVYDRAAADAITALRAKHDRLIGVLIRQTDYRGWQDGRFFFPTSDYVHWIRQLIALHSDRRVGFVIASDEWQDPALFTGLPVYFTAGSVNRGGEGFMSFAELMRCDVVVSPPSTFSATAAFVGSVPLWPLVSSTQSLAFDQILPDALCGAAAHPEFGRAVK